MPKALPVDWVAARMCVTAGMSLEEVAAKFSVPLTAIWKRSSREGWFTEKREAIAAETKRCQAVSAAVSETWAQKGERHRNTVFDLATKAIREAKVSAPKNFKDLEIADRMARRAAGLDKDDGSSRTIVNIGLLGNEETMVFEAESVSNPSLLDDSPE